MIPRGIEPEMTGREAHNLYGYGYISFGPKIVIKWIGRKPISLAQEPPLLVVLSRSSSAKKRTREERVSNNVRG